MKRFFAIVLSIIFLVNCSDNSVEPINTSIDDDIREIVLRYQIDHLYETFDNPSFQVYYISQGIEDTNETVDFLFVEISDYQPFDEAFVARFNGINPPVKNYSECDNRNGFIYDPVSNEIALAFYVGKIIYNDTNKVKILGGYWSTPAGALAAYHYLTLTNNSIVIDSVKRHWISKQQF